MMTPDFHSLLAKVPHGAARRDPVRDWIVALITAGIALSAIIVWNIWTFDTVARGGVIGPAAPTEQTFFDDSSLSAVRVIFEKRSDEEAKYRTGTYRFADPSQ